MLSSGPARDGTRHVWHDYLQIELGRGECLVDLVVQPELP
jgi:hypothetical protein